MLIDIFGKTKLDSVEHDRFVAVFVEKFPSDQRLKEIMKAGNLQIIFDSVVIPVGCESVFITNLVGYPDRVKRSGGVDIDAGFLFQPPVVLFDFGISLLVIEQKGKPGPYRLVLKSRAPFQIVIIGHIPVSLQKYVGYDFELIADFVLKVQIGTQRRVMIGKGTGGI